MTRVVWTRQAIEDVEAIKAYVARDSVHYAARLSSSESSPPSGDWIRFRVGAGVVPESVTSRFVKSSTGPTALCTESSPTQSKWPRSITQRGSSTRNQRSEPRG